MCFLLHDYKTTSVPTLHMSIFREKKRTKDSTVLRNVGLPLAHTAIALTSIQRGLGKLLVNKVGWLEKHCMLMLSVFFFCVVLLFFFFVGGVVGLYDRMCKCWYGWENDTREVQLLSIVVVGVEKFGFQWVCYPKCRVTSLWEICRRLCCVASLGESGKGTTIFRRGLVQTGNETKTQEDSMVDTTVVGCLECPESRISFMSRFKDKHKTSSTMAKHNSKLVYRTFFHHRKNTSSKNWFYQLILEKVSTSTKLPSSKLCFAVTINLKNPREFAILHGETLHPFCKYFWVSESQVTRWTLVYLS